jgi:hypothetical protein
MTIRHRIARVAAVAGLLAMVTVVSFASGAGADSTATPAQAAAQAQAALGNDAPAIAATGFSCSSEYWCDYIYDNGTGLCFKVSPFAGPGNIPNWGTYGCRNVDGSIENNSNFTLRIYWGPNYEDPHACIPAFTKIRDLFNYDFNSGSGPHNLVIGNDIASSTISLNRCTNPL